MLLGISLTYIALIIFIHVIVLLKKIKISFSNYILLMVIFAFFYAYSMSQIEPPKNWDLSRHYIVIDEIRENGIEFAFTESRYHYLYVITFLFYLVSLTPYNELIVFIVCFLEILIFIITIYNLQKHKPRKNFIQIYALAFFVFLAFVNIVESASALRNTFAFVICAYALFRAIYLKRNFLFSILLVIISIFIHPASIIFLSFLLASKIKAYKLTQIVILLLPLFITSIAQQMSVSSIKVIREAGQLFEMYNGFNGEKEIRFDIRLILLNLAAIGISAYASLRSIRVQERSTLDVINIDYCRIIIAILFSIVIGLLMPIIFFRMLYSLSILLIPIIVDFYYNDANTWTVTKLIFIILIIGLLAFNTYTLYLSIFVFE